jgi:hypothetical protein
MSSNEIERVRPLISDLVKIGFFRLSDVVTTLGAEEMLAIAKEESEDSLITVDGGWCVTNWEETLATVTMCRIAGVVHEPVKMSQVNEALMRAIAYGPFTEKPAVRRERAKTWIECYDALPSRAVISQLCDLVGARMSSAGGVDWVDFTYAFDPIEPSDNERAILYALEESPYGALQVSRLCRRVGRSRTSTYQQIESMPYILKDHVRAACLIGADGHPEDWISGEAEFFHSFSMTSDGERAKVELNANEECIESNSCNIPVECRRLVEGVYTEVNTGIEIKIEHPSGPDKRKVAGLSQVVRNHFGNYASKDKVFLILDKATGEARVDVVSIHATQKMDFINTMFRDGIRQGALADLVDEAPGLGMAA